MKRDSGTGQFTPTSVAERLLARILVHESSQCWIWQGHCTKRGYGLAKDSKRKTRQVHRLAYETFIGSIPDALEIDHLCKVRACINPAHLEPVTGLVNNRRSSSPTAVNATKASCPKGHPYDEHNTYIYKGGRNCKECSRQRVRARRAALMD